MTTGIVVGSILLSVDQKFGVEKLTVAAGSDLVNGRRVQVDEERAGHVFTTARLGEEGLIGAAVKDILRVRVGTTIKTKTVLEKIPDQCRRLKNGRIWLCFVVYSINIA